MANMSYCRFRNTLQDLRDCYYNMNGSLTGEEFYSREALVELCKSIGEEFGDMNFKEEEEEEEVEED
jgi:hypothetical protein